MSITWNPFTDNLDFTGSGGSGSIWNITDGVNTVSAVGQLTVVGGTVSGTSPNATLTISGSAVSIPEYSTDPVSPSPNEAWVLVTSHSGGGGAGTPIGMLLALTQSGTGGATTYTYQFSYYTNEGTTVRTTLS